MNGVFADLEHVPWALKMRVWQKSLQISQFCVSILRPSKLKIIWVFVHVVFARGMFFDLIDFAIPSPAKLNK